MNAMWSTWVRVALLGWLVFGVSSSIAEEKRPVTTLHVFAASSLTESFAEIAKQFEKDHPHTKVELNFAGTPTLRTQIEQGAPADVFASADRVHSEALQEKELLLSTTVFARNKLVIAAPAKNEKVQSIADLAQPKIKIVVADQTVPAGRYAMEVIRKIDAGGTGGAGFLANVEKNLVSRETNVRAVLSKVVLGEADASIVYLTDAATAGKKIRLVQIPDAVNAVVEYPIGVLARSPHLPLAKDFVATVVSDKGQAILKAHGFLP
jgi:molybdate transport system substrate-binding protein